MEIFSERLVHIHEVLDMLSTWKESLNTTEFIEAIEERFGCDTYFTSCAGQVFSRDAIIPFLIDKRKIKLVEDRIFPLVLTCTR